MEGSIGFTEKSQIYFPGNISYLSERLEKDTAENLSSSKHNTAVDLNILSWKNGTYFMNSSFNISFVTTSSFRFFT
jgi:hypothetical protein